MIRHYLKLIIRQIKKDKFFMLVKISGLAIGMAASLMMMLYIYHQSNFDTFHKNKDQIYQLIIEMHREGLIEKLGVGTAEMGVSLLEEFPEITVMTRFSMHSEAYFEYDDQVKQMKDFQYADSSVFDLFTFPMLRGNPKTALTAPFTMVLTESGSRQLFGDTDPMGKVLRMNGKQDYLVTGIMKDPPPNSHLQFKALGSFSTLYQLENQYMDWDGGWGYYTYVLVAENTDWDNMVNKFPDFLEKHINYKYRNFGVELRFKFDNLPDIYLHSSAPEHLFISGNVTNLYIFGAVAIFILLIACINFMNLSTARFSARTSEVGIRKVFGAFRSQLIFQFLSESVVISFLSLAVALTIAEIFLPGFSQLFNTNIRLGDIHLTLLIPALIVLVGFVGILSGSYPAFFLSSFKPDLVIKGALVTVNKGRWFRNVLVVVQFFISATLIISTIGVFRQLRYMNSKPLGFDRENVLVLELMGEKAQQSVDHLKTRIKQLSYVVNTGASTNVPVWGLTSNGYIPEGMETSMIINVLDADEDWLETMQIGIIEGRNFEKTDDDQRNIIINQSLAKKMGWDQPVGKSFNRDGKHEVIGVVGDFHFTPLHHPIQPLIITCKPFDYFYYLSVRLNVQDYRQALDDIEKIWIEMVPGEPFIYQFLDQMLLSTYEKEEKFGKGFTWFAIVAIFLACLGLYALASYLTLQRKKEIGIRKTFGADVGMIVLLLGKDFLKLVVIGDILAMVVSWLFMEKWMENFAFRVQQTWWPYLFTLFITVIIAILTVAWQSFKAARQNPMDAIKYE
ncbi:MAG: ABC transporter permease [Bacteroidales bacterium]|nr:ABC transporter permease [Bacteroidales bacterium]